MLAGHDPGRGNLLAQPAEALEVVRRQRLFDPVDVVRLEGLGQLQRVPLRQGHPAVHHHVAVPAYRLAGALDQFDVLADSRPAVGGPVGKCQFQPLVAELHVLLDVVARAVAGDPRMDPAAQKPPNRRVQHLAGDVPQGDIDAGDRVDRNTLAAVRHRRAPHDVPQPLNVERILAHQQPGQVIFHDHASAGSARAVALDALVGVDLHPEAPNPRPGRAEQAAHRLVLRVDRDRVRDLHAAGRPRSRRRLVAGHRTRRAHGHQPYAGDLEVVLHDGRCGERVRRCRR